MVKNKKLNFFFCPASDYLNQYNETGSHGQISYQFLSHLAKKTSVQSLFGAVIMTLNVSPIAKTTIIPLLKKGPGGALSDFDSLYFYLFSYLKFINSTQYRNADVIHHIIPFALGRSFNLYFLFRRKDKKYFIGPIIGPHSSTQITADEEYVFSTKKSFIIKSKEAFIQNSKKILLGTFGSILNYLSIKTLQNADIVFFSDNHAMNYHKKFMKKGQQAIILDTGIDTNVFKPNSKKLSSKDDILHVLFVGRLTKRKGCEYLIRAIDEVVRVNKNIKLVCDIHGIGPLEKELKDLTKKLKIEKYFNFLGGVKSNEEIVKRYYNCDIVCLPALSETFTVTKEAMACAKPVIVTDICSNAERVKPGINGYVVPPADSNAIAKVLLNIAGKKSLLNKLSQNALKTRPLYDWDNILNNYLKIIR